MSADADTEQVTGRPMAAAAEPRGVAEATWWGLLWGVLFAALGIVAIREGLLGLGVFGDVAELPGLLDGLDGLRFGAWPAVAGVLALLVGLLTAIAVLRRRPRRHYRLACATGVYLSFGEVAKLVEHAASSVPGVLSARARPSRKQVRVFIATTGADSIADEVQELATLRLRALAAAPGVKVRATAAGREVSDESRS